MKSVNIAVSLVLLAFTGFYAFLIWNLPSRDLPHTLGASFMPWVLAGCLFFLSLLLLCSSVFQRAGLDRKVDLPLKDVGGILGLLALILVYIQAMIHLGFLIATVIFLAVLALISGSKRPLEIIIFSIVTTAAIYFLFNHFFNVVLPAGEIF